MAKPFLTNGDPELISTVTLLPLTVPLVVGRFVPCGAVGREQDARNDAIADEAPNAILPTVTWSKNSFRVIAMANPFQCDTLVMNQHCLNWQSFFFPSPFLSVLL